MRRPRHRFTVRRMMAAVIVAALTSSYVGSYYKISRRGFQEASTYGIDGFLYVTVAEAPSQEGQFRHLALATWYAPLNWLDRHLFSGRPPASGLMWRLSG